MEAPWEPTEAPLNCHENRINNHAHPVGAHESPMEAHNNSMKAPRKHVYLHASPMKAAHKYHGALMEVLALSWAFLVLWWYFHGAFVVVHALSWRSLGGFTWFMLGVIMLSWAYMVLPLALMGLGVGETCPPKPIPGADDSRAGHVDVHGVVACEAVGPSRVEVGGWLRKTEKGNLYHRLPSLHGIPTDKCGQRGVPSSTECERRACWPK